MGATEEAVVRADEKTRVEELIRKRHKGKLQKDERVEVVHVEDEVHDTMSFLVHTGDDVFRFEAQVEKKDVRPRGASVDLLLDFLDGVLEEWLEGDREAYPTLEFSPYEFEDVTIMLRGGLERPGLEEEADRLLGGK
ncbi:MAG: hypothetical protein AB2A00_06910 [Myxococcota bacterium]